MGASLGAPLHHPAERAQPKPGSPHSPDSGPTKDATITFIQVTCIPAGHLKIIRAELESWGVGEGNCVFEPALQMLNTKGLSMADAVVGFANGRGVNFASQTEVKNQCY